MNEPGDIFAVERDGETLVVTPLANLRELDYTLIEAGSQELLNILDRGEVKNVVLDFGGTDYYGSTALGVLVKLWKRVRTRGGKMALCNLSAHEREILTVTRLEDIWPICASRAEAVLAVQGNAARQPC